MRSSLLFPHYFFVHKKATLCSRPCEDCTWGHSVKVELVGSYEKQAAKISSAWPIATPDTHMRTYIHVYLFLFCLLLTVRFRRHTGATQGYLVFVVFLLPCIADLGGFGFVSFCFTKCSSPLLICDERTMSLKAVSLCKTCLVWVWQTKLVYSSPPPSPIGLVLFANFFFMSHCEDFPALFAVATQVVRC